MIRELVIHSESWPLNRPFRISRGEKTAVETVMTVIREVNTNSVGRGEAVPYARYGESLPSVMSQLESMRPLVEGGLSRESLLKSLPAGAARNAIDCALWDLEAQVSGMDVANVLGEFPVEPMTTAVTIGLDAPAAMAAAARAIALAPLIKIKVDARDAAAQIQAVREVCPQSELIVDPNESWDLDILRAMQPVLVEQRIAVLEQPLPAGSDSLLDGFVTSVPICADESCHTAADLPQLIGRYQFINIKLDKTGGLTTALDLLHQARSRGFGIMVGCMICTSLSIAPALHVARHARFADLDGPLWLARDRAGGITLTNQRLQPPQRGFWGELHENSALVQQVASES